MYPTTTNTAFRRAYGDPDATDQMASAGRRRADRLLDPLHRRLNSALGATIEWHGPAADAFRIAMADDLARIRRLIDADHETADMLGARAAAAAQRLCACRQIADLVTDRDARVRAALDALGPELAAAATVAQPAINTRLVAAAQLLGPAAAGVATPAGHPAALAQLFGVRPDLDEADDPTWADYRLPDTVDEFLRCVDDIAAAGLGEPDAFDPAPSPAQPGTPPPPPASPPGPWVPRPSAPPDPAPQTGSPGVIIDNGDGTFTLDRTRATRTVARAAGLAGGRP